MANWLKYLKLQIDVWVSSEPDDQSDGDGRPLKLKTGTLTIIDWWLIYRHTGQGAKCYDPESPPDGGSVVLDKKRSLSFSLCKVSVADAWCVSDPFLMLLTLSCMIPLRCSIPLWQDLEAHITVGLATLPQHIPIQDAWMEENTEKNVQFTDECRLNAQIYEQTMEEAWNPTNASSSHTT